MILALLAVTKKRELGIDVEFIKESIVSPEIAECFFSAAEIAELRALPREQQRAAFFAGWTRKESYIKGTGAGLFGPLDRFTVSLAPDESRVSLRVHDDEREAARWTLCSLHLGEGYAGALAGRRQRLAIAMLQLAAEVAKSRPAYMMPTVVLRASIPPTLQALIATNEAGAL